MDAGTKLSLKNVNLYIDAYTSKRSTTVTGAYYLYDGKNINGRYRITNSTTNVGKTPVGKFVTGWINKKDVESAAVTQKATSSNTSSSGSVTVENAVISVTETPTYSVMIIAADGTKYNVTNALCALTLAEQKSQIAQKVSIKLFNLKYDGTSMHKLFDIRNRVYVYAKLGSKKEEVFRGFIWEITPKVTAKEQILSLTCYDGLIYFIKSEDSKFFSAGKSTKDICTSLCKSWGMKLNYSYSSITHPKMPLRGYLGDIFLDDLLEAVRKKKGKKYVMRSEKDVICIRPAGANTTIYQIQASVNALESEYSKSMENMVTKVVITGKEDDDKRAPVSATLKKNTEKYGTLQKLMNCTEGSELADVKAEANQTLKDHATPEKEFSVTAIDIPWVRKGDQVYISSGLMKNYYVVLGVIHHADDGEMDLELERFAE